MNESRPKKNCFACDHQELQEIKACPPVLSLVDEIEKLRIRLKECRLENNYLREDLHLAKKLMRKDPVPPHLYTIRNIGPEMRWKEKTDAAIKLSRQIQECQEELEQLEAAKAAIACDEENARRQAYVEKRPFWRVELEKRQSKGDEVVVDPITKECNELRAKLEGEKSRFKSLNREVKLVKNELQRRKDSNQEELGLKKSYEAMEEQLLEIQSEISRIRLKWAEVKSRNQNLAKEISEYRNKIKAVQEDSEANNTLINDLTVKHRATQKVIDSRKCIVQQIVSRYEDDLEEDSVFVELAEIYEAIQNITDEKISLVRDLEVLVAQGLPNKETEARTPEALESTQKPEGEIQIESENVDSLSKGNEESDDAEPRDTAINPKLEKLLVQCEKYKTLTEAVKSETDRWVYIASLQENHLNELAKQVVQTKRLVFEKTEYLNKENRIQAVKFPKSRPQETSKIRIKVKALRDENEYLRAFLKNAMENKVNDTKICKSFMNDSKSFFDDAFVRFKDASKIWKSKITSNLKQNEEQNETPED